MNHKPITNTLFAKKHLQSTMTEEYVQWAIDMLELEFDSKNLRILAGLSNPLNPWEVDHYFELALNDLNISKPNKEEAIKYYSIYLCEQMLNGEISPSNGLEKFCWIAQELDYPDEYMMWYELEDAVLNINCEYFCTYKGMNKSNVSSYLLKEAKLFADKLRNETDD